MTTMTAELQLDKAATLLAHLLCSDKATPVTGANEAAFTRFDRMTLRAAYTTQLSGGRIFSTDPAVLLESVQDLIGDQCEVAVLAEDIVKWFGYRKLRKTPRGCWASVMRPTWYEFHCLTIGQDGVSTYDKDVVALMANGSPARVMFQGAGTRGGHVDERSGRSLVMSASIVEDAHRPGALLATVTDGASVLTPVPNGEHRELFALRDAPMTKAGRRKAILHWVAQHTRAAKLERVSVSEHWRGARAISIDGLTVSLTPNMGAQP